ncbi:amidase [Gordonia hydrophobica]|uniref:amidase n=1 Tax=Gordonia hydrophobica TaxID=40516 RepID=A0ABZ2U302_9ACTN|nr:amidase family protein [Gordonia hydrophobica]MBM7367640.1 Asp-tRNA(Asn)/Glu-tRNA(Gln) amidotransferase A subunit family amidase [Gordonia hydrophobica]
MNLDEYMRYDATGLAELVADGQVTSAELLDLARQRLRGVNPAINSVVIETEAEADIRVQHPLPGPFAGVPFLIKDLAQEYRGYPTTSGCRALRNTVETENALVTDRFLDAGLVIFGKTNTPELGAKGITESDLWGPCRNPWDVSRTPGGSSGGSAAAVAAGIVPAAGANDGGGSIRIPAATTGLVGLKPSRGLAPYGPSSGEPMFGMAVQGVVARTVRDSAGLMDAIVDPNRFADYQVAQPDRPFAEVLGDRPARLRIGFSGHSAIRGDATPEATAALEHTAQLLADLGHHVEEVTPPYDDKALAETFLTIWFAQVVGQVAEIKERTGAGDRDFEADTLAMVEVGRANGVAKLFRALDEITGYTRAMETFYESFDYFMTPTLAESPIKIGALDTPKPLQAAARIAHRVHGGSAMVRTGIIDQMIEANLGWVPYTQLANLTGRPAISVPVYWTPEGLPLGVSFNGTLGSDAALLRLAAQLEEAAPWIQRFPAQPVSRP